MRPTLLALLALAAGCLPPGPPSVRAELSCVPEGAVLRQRCTVTLTDRRTGQGVGGATVTLHADMPSMPLVHAVRPVTATPGARAGSYHGTLELEMSGRWVIAVRIAGPVNDQITHILEVE